jgi:hypothetical protein
MRGVLAMGLALVLVIAVLIGVLVVGTPPFTEIVDPLPSSGMDL